MMMNIQIPTLTRRMMSYLLICSLESLISTKKNPKLIKALVFLDQKEQKTLRSILGMSTLRASKRSWKSLSLHRHRISIFVAIGTSIPMNP